MIDMTFFSPFNAELGFNLSVESIHSNTQAQPFFFGIIATLCPSAAFYDTNKQTPPKNVP
jgi:hypothetical protein